MDDADQPPTPLSGKQDGLPRIVPDFYEQDHGDEIDNIVPSRGYQMTPMVGIGGSAGGISALIEFFEAMPPESGMIFVVVIHLSPTHESTLAGLLARSTEMPVIQATDGIRVQPNHVYVIPPGKYLATVDGHLILTELENDRGKRVAVDIFFRSLADTHGPHSAAIVLSGADGDGALGIKRIKERGGLTIAQDPDQAEYPGMPQAAIETGMVDWVLEAGKIPQRLINYRDTGARLSLPPEEGPTPGPLPQPVATDGEAALRDVLIFLRARTGRDFSYYKRATILRRIARRMQVNDVADLQGYLNFLRTHPGESGALLQDLLISVTNFFRDRDVFLALESLIPTLFKNKGQSDTIRVWVPACATGEEAYSMAMMLIEHARLHDSPPVLQVFACDLDEEAIQTARLGQYPDTIAADVSEERLRKFFVKDAKGYRVRRELREMVLFASHDLLKDAPFSRMDFVSCRNLLIYLTQEAQQRCFETFHFALRPEGLLLLGSSESVPDGSPLFRVVDKKHRIYTQQPTARTGLPLPSGPSSLMRVIATQERGDLAPVIHGKNFVSEVTAGIFSDRLATSLDRASLAELHFKLIERYSPPSLIVNAEHEILHLSEHAGAFLRFAGGELTSNLLRVVLPELRIDLRTTLFRAAETHRRADSFVQVNIDGRPSDVHISVAPAAEIAPGFFLVIFDRRPSGSESKSIVPMPETVPEPLVRHLERELEQAKSNLRDIVEQYEASTEELKASNEELQSMNEELRSATEELETSREELQSINEELTTVNQEMKGKMEEVAHANSDLQNLMASTLIATVFLDRELAVTRFTPTAAKIFNLILSDVGRPLAHLKNDLDYPDLIADAEQVLQTLVPIEREVSDGKNWYLARVQPYRTVEDNIAGAVLTLVDVTERNRAIEALKVSEERSRLLIEGAKDYAIFSTDPQRIVDTWNKGAETLYGYSEAEIVGRPADILFIVEDRNQGEPEREMLKAKEEGHAENERWQLRKDGSNFYGSGSVTPLWDADRTLRGYVKIIRDLTERKQAEEALREHMVELTRFNAAAVGRETRMIELKKEVNGLKSRLNEPPAYPLGFEQGGEKESP